MNYLKDKEQRMLVARYLIAEKLKVDIVNAQNAVVKLFDEEIEKIHRSLGMVEKSLAMMGLSDYDIQNVTSELECSKRDLDDRVDDAYDWILDFASKNDLAQCDKKLAKLRKAHERGLRKDCKRIGYGAKMISQPQDKEAEYIIYKKGKSYTGTYTEMKNMVKDIEHRRKRGDDIE